MMKQHSTFIGNSIRDFHPAYFAMVMATGIVSIAFEELAFPGIARMLFALNLFFYLILCTILIARIVFFLPNLMTDFRNLRRVLLLLTFVVGTNTIGIQLITFHQAVGLSFVLWLVALIGWFLCIYFILHAFIPMWGKPVHQILNGAALLIVVSTVSVSLLGIRLLDVSGVHAVYAYFIVGIFWILGFVLYLIIVMPLVYRLFFRRFELEDWDAPYWICMGAAAIITLVSSGFIMRIPALPAWESIIEIILWITVFVWVIGTWWIPYLLIMDIRKFIHADTAASMPTWIKIFPWSRLAFGRQYHAYDPSSWSRVFPMGMYTASTLSLAKATGFGYLAIISQYWSWFVLIIWSLTLIGMFRAVIFVISGRT